MAGYSQTPLAKKLGVKVGSTIFVENAPCAYEDLLAPMPEKVALQASIGPATDIIHVFSTSKSHLAKFLKKSVARMRPDAAVWVSWPKKASGVSTDVTEDTIREIAFALGMVDIKVCAVDETWSGLKLVIRKENRARV
jgi:hypothetical protein